MDLFVTISLVDYPAIVSSIIFAFRLDIRDQCEAAAGLTITSDSTVPPTAVTYYLDGSSLELNESLPFTNSHPALCPVTYTCNFVFQSGSVTNCDPTDPDYSFDSSTGAFTLHASGAEFAGLTPTLQVTAIGGTDQDVSATHDAYLITFPCTITRYEFNVSPILWTIPIEEETDVIIKPYYPTMTYTAITLDPFTPGSTIYDDSTCAVHAPIDQFFETEVYNSQTGALMSSADGTYAA